MKNQRSNIQASLILIVISATGLLISIIMSCTNIAKNAMVSFVLFFVILISVILFIGSITALIMFNLLELEDKKSYEKNMEKIKSKLSNEFSQVKLKDPEDETFIEGIPNKEIKVMAKLDENDNIIFTIQVDAQIMTDSYEWFVNYFDV